MSLTTLLKEKDVAQRFAQEFPVPSVSLEGPVIATPLSKNYGLVGTAFDYLLRFFLELLNGGRCINRRWVAELAPKYIPSLDQLDVQGRIDLVKKARHMLVGALLHHGRYLDEGVLSDEVIRSCLHLAYLDGIYRGHRITQDFGKVDERDVQDLRNLIAIVVPAKFVAFNHCYLNPTFGVASEIVGGADADLLIDNALIEIKTTKYLSLKPEYYHQLIGYYLLAMLGKEHGRLELPEIDRICIYYARQAYMLSVSIEDIRTESAMRGGDNLENVADWLAHYVLAGMGRS